MLLITYIYFVTTIFIVDWVHFNWGDTLTHFCFSIVIGKIYRFLPRSSTILFFRWCEEVGLSSWLRCFVLPWVGEMSQPWLSRQFNVRVLTVFSLFYRRFDLHRRVPVGRDLQMPVRRSCQVASLGRFWEIPHSWHNDNLYPIVCCTFNLYPKIYTTNI